MTTAYVLDRPIERRLCEPFTHGMQEERDTGGIDA